MRIFRRFFGLIAVLFGLVGFLACIAGLVGLWLANSQLKEGAGRAVEPADKYIGFTLTRLDSSEQRIVEIRARLLTMKVQVEQLAAVDPGLLGQRLDQLDLSQQSVQDGLQHAELNLQLARDTITTLTDLGDLVEQVPQVSLDHLSSTGPLATEVENANEQLKEFTSILDQIRETLNKVRAAQEQANQPMLIELGELIKRAESRIGQSHEAIVRFREALRKTQHDISSLREKMPRWIDAASWVLTVVLAWLGISQFALLAYGNSLLKS